MREKNSTERKKVIFYNEKIQILQWEMVNFWWKRQNFVVRKGKLYNEKLQILQWEIEKFFNEKTQILWREMLFFYNERQAIVATISIWHECHGYWPTLEPWPLSTKKNEKEYTV